MSDEPRFGTDTDALVNVMRSGVQYTGKISQIFSQLHTSDEGLPSFPAHLTLRQSTFGRNEVAPSTLPSHKSYSSLLHKSFSELEPRFIRNILIIWIVLQILNSLLAASLGDKQPDVLALYVSLLLEIVRPIILLILPILIEASIEYRRQSSLARVLNRVWGKEGTSLILRDGQLQSIPSKDIVVGDVCQLNASSEVPADGVLLEKGGITFSSKDSVIPNVDLCCNAGTIVSEGSGRMVVIAVGPNTQVSLLAKEPPLSKGPIDVSCIFYWAITLGLFTVVVCLLRFCLSMYLIDGQDWHLSHLKNIVRFFTFGLTVFDSVIPFVLPFVIVWSFSHAQKKFGSHRSPVAKSFALASISRFLQFILTFNFVIALLNVWGFISIGKSSHALSDVQLIWVLLTGNILAISLLPSDMPDAPISHKSEPEGNSEPEQTFAISFEIRKNILGQLIYQIAVLSAISFCSDSCFSIENRTTHEPSIQGTMIFNTFVLMTIFNILFARLGGNSVPKGRNFFSGLLNHPLFCTLLCVFTFLQVLIVQNGGLSFHTQPLNLYEWLISISLALGVLLWAQLLICVDFDKLRCLCCKSPEGEQNSRARKYENAECTPV